MPQIIGQKCFKQSQHSLAFLALQQYMSANCYRDNCRDVTRKRQPHRS